MALIAKTNTNPRPAKRKNLDTMITANTLDNGGFNGKIYGYGAEKSIYLNGVKTVLTAQELEFVNKLVASKSGFVCPITGQLIRTNDSSFICPTWAEIEANRAAEAAGLWFAGEDKKGAFAVYAFLRKGNSFKWERKIVFCRAAGQAEISVEDALKFAP